MGTRNYYCGVLFFYFGFFLLINVVLSNITFIPSNDVNNNFINAIAPEIIRGERNIFLSNGKLLYVGSENSEIAYNLATNDTLSSVLNKCALDLSSFDDVITVPIVQCNQNFNKYLFVSQSEKKICTCSSVLPNCIMIPWMNKIRNIFSVKKGILKKTNGEEYCTTNDGEALNTVLMVVGTVTDEAQKALYISRNIIKQSNKDYYKNDLSGPSIKDLVCMLTVSDKETYAVDDAFCIGTNAKTEEEIFNYLTKVRVFADIGYEFSADTGQSSNGEGDPNVESEPKIEESITNEPYIIYYNDNLNTTHIRKIADTVSMPSTNSQTYYYSNLTKVQYQVNIVGKVIYPPGGKSNEIFMFVTTGSNPNYILGSLCTKSSVKTKNMLVQTKENSTAFWIKPIGIVSGSRGIQILQHYNGSIVLNRNDGVISLIGLRNLSDSGCIISDSGNRICQQLFVISVPELIYNKSEDICSCSSVCLDTEASTYVIPINNIMNKGKVELGVTSVFENAQSVGNSEGVLFIIIGQESVIDVKAILISVDEMTKLDIEINELNEASQNSTRTLSSFYKMERNKEIKKGNQKYINFILFNKGELRLKDSSIWTTASFTVKTSFTDLNDVINTSSIILTPTDLAAECNNNKFISAELTTAGNFFVLGAESIKKTPILNSCHYSYNIVLDPKFIDPETNIISSDISLYLQYMSNEGNKSILYTVYKASAESSYILELNEHLWKESSNYDSMLNEAQSKYLDLSGIYKNKAIMIMGIGAGVAVALVAASITMCSLIRNGQQKIEQATKSYEEQKQRVDTYIKKMQSLIERGAMRVDKKERIVFTHNSNKSSAFKQQPSATLLTPLVVKPGIKNQNIKTVVSKVNPVDEYSKNISPIATSSDSDKSNMSMNNHTSPIPPKTDATRPIPPKLIVDSGSAKPPTIEKKEKDLDNFGKKSSSQRQETQNLSTEVLVKPLITPTKPIMIPKPLALTKVLPSPKPLENKQTSAPALVKQVKPQMMPVALKRKH